MSRKSLTTVAAAGSSRSPSKRSSIGGIHAKVPPPPAPIEPQRERALIDACTRGDAAAASALLAQIHDQQADGQRRSSSRELEELVGYAFACAAGGNHVNVLELLLRSSGLAVHQALRHGICREPRFFAPRCFFHCCFALRYTAFAAVVSIEQRALLSLEWLTAWRLSEEGDEGQDGDDSGEEEGLLMDVDVMRCFRLAFSLACGSFAVSSTTPGPISQPEQFRPLLMRLLSRYPKLLLPLVHSAQPVNELLLTPVTSSNGHNNDAAVVAAAQALRSSLLYERMTNTT
jgi:hypothetical protein